jgi:hypothetical protein
MRRLIGRGGGRWRVEMATGFEGAVEVIDSSSGRVEAHGAQAAAEIVEG